MRLEPVLTLKKSSVRYNRAVERIKQWFLAVDDFKAKLRGGGARPNLFKATINFPAYAGGDVEITSFLCEAAQLPGSIMGIVTVPFRGRQLKIAGDRTFDTWSPTIINDTDFKVRNSMETLDERCKCSPSKHWSNQSY